MINQNIVNQNAKVENTSTNRMNSVNDEASATNIEKTATIVVLLASIELKNGKLQTLSQGALFGDSLEDKVKAGMIFDLVNCSGYLAQARYTGKESKNVYGFDMEILPASMRSDLAEAVKRCGGYQGDDGIEGTSAFAVYPSQAERKQLRTEFAPNFKAVYDSLPSAIKKWRASHNTPGEREPQYYETLEPKTDWADVDGNGEVDLITVDGACSGTPGDDLNCIKVLYRENGVWHEVTTITPA